MSSMAANTPPTIAPILGSGGHTKRKTETYQQIIFKDSLFLFQEAKGAWVFVEYLLSVNYFKDNVVT